MDPSVFTFLHLFSSYAEQFSLTKRTTSFPLDHTGSSVDFDRLHQSLSGYSGAGDSEVSLCLTEAVVDGRVASFSVGVPSGPTGRNGQAGRLQADRCSKVKSLLPDSR